EHESLDWHTRTNCNPLTVVCARRILAERNGAIPLKRSKEDGQNGADGALEFVDFGVAISKRESTSASVIRRGKIIPGRGVGVRIGLQKAIVDAVGMLIQNYKQISRPRDRTGLKKLAVVRKYPVDGGVWDTRVKDAEKHVHGVRTRSGFDSRTCL